MSGVSGLRHGDSSGDRLLAVLGLFSIEAPAWTVEAAAKRLKVSEPTCYRYFRRLLNAGLIAPAGRGSYALGPAIIEMDRQIQIADPMLAAARSVMTGLVDYAAEGAIVLLCRLFRDRVMCVHQVMGRGPQSPVSYERGRLMPLFRGATSKIILAYLPPRALKRLHAEYVHEIAAAGLGASAEAFRRNLAALRRDGVAVTKGDLDPGRVGVAAPIFDRDRAVLGSLSFVLPEARAGETMVGRLAPLIRAGAREIEQAMNGNDERLAAPQSAAQ